MIANTYEVAVCAAPSACAVSFSVPNDDAAAFNSLPAKIRADVDRTLLALETLHAADKILPACKQLAPTLSLHRALSWSRLKMKYYAYAKSGDWRVLVDWTRVKKTLRPGGLNDSDTEALPPDFREFLKGLMGANQRKSAPAIRKLYHLWESGHSVPGYGTWQEYFQAQHPYEPLPLRCPPDKPRGWSRSNLTRCIPAEADLALARQGVAEASRHLPDIMMTRAGLRPLEFVMFDDVRTDFRILVPGCDRPVQLNLLVALDVATGMILRYGLRPAIPREDGMLDKLKLRDMKALVCGILLTYGIPRDYQMTLVVENATAAIRNGFEAALQELGRSLSGRAGSPLPAAGIAVHRTEMKCGSALFAGYKDRPSGNPGGKAPLESTFNLFHNELADTTVVPGQIGRRYDAGPAELHGRTAETVALNRTARHLTPHQRAALKYPFLNCQQARLVISDVFARLIRRTDHAMEAFETIGEFRLGDHEQWRPEAELAALTIPANAGHIQWRNPPRKESPLERWSRLGALVPPSIHVHPGTAARLLEDQKPVTVINSEIVFQCDKETFVYRLANLMGAPASPLHQLKTQKSQIKNLLAYFDRDDLSFIHLTDGAGSYLGSLPRTRGVSRTDPAALKAEFERKRGELSALQQRVSARLPELAEQRLADLDHNAQVLSDALAGDALPSPSPGGEGRGEGEQSHTICPPHLTALNTAASAAAATTAAAEARQISPVSTDDNFSELLARADADEASLQP